MKTEEISFYKEFSCIMSDCPHSCCKGWHIPVDETTLENYHKEKGIKGLMLLFSTFKLEKRLTCLRGIYFGCNFRTGKNLCRFHKEGRFDLQPKICRNYPRRLVLYPDRMEKTLDLSCYEAARLFIKNPDKPKFIESEEETPLSEVTWVVENDEEKYLFFLRDDRELLLKHISRDRDIFAVMSDVYGYIWNMQQALVKDGVNAAKEIQNEGILLLSEEKIKRPFYPIKMLNELVFEEITEPDLFLRNPYLYKLTGKYEKHYKNIYERDADAFFLDAYTSMTESGYIDPNKYRAYLSYSIQENYCEAYEDYYPLGKILLDFVYIQFLMLFDTVMFLEGADPDINTQARVLSSVEKGIRHSNQTEKQFLEKIRKSFM